MSAAERAHAHRRGRRGRSSSAGGRPEQAATHLVRTVPAVTISSSRRCVRRPSRRSRREPHRRRPRICSRALEEPPRREERARVLYELGVAELQSGAAESARHLRQAIDEARGRDVVARDRARLLARDGSRRADLAVDARSPATDERPDARGRRRPALAHRGPDDHRRSLRPRALPADRRTARNSARRLGAGRQSEPACCWPPGRSRRPGVEFRGRARWTTRRVPCRARFTIRAPASSPSTSSTRSRSPARSKKPPRGYEVAIELAQTHGDVLSLAILYLFRARLRAQVGDLRAAEEDLAADRADGVPGRRRSPAVLGRATWPSSSSSAVSWPRRNGWSSGRPAVAQRGHLLNFFRVRGLVAFRRRFAGAGADGLPCRRRPRPLAAHREPGVRAVAVGSRARPPPPRPHRRGA